MKKWNSKNLKQLGGEKGVLHLPLAICLIIITITGMGAWGILRHWRHLVESQLQLDRCVGQVAHHLRDSLKSIETSNDTIKKIRVALAAATLLPEAQPPLKAALEFQVAKQEIKRAAWVAQQISWLISRCDHAANYAMPLPDLPWTRDPPDMIGPQPLRKITETHDLKFSIQAGRSPRHAAAIVTENSKEFNASSFTKWTAKWTKPKIPFFGSGIR